MNILIIFDFRIVGHKNGKNGSKGPTATKVSMLLIIIPQYQTINKISFILRRLFTLNFYLLFMFTKLRILQEESLSIKDKLKKKMLQQIKKTFKVYLFFIPRPE